MDNIFRTKKISIIGVFGMLVVLASFWFIPGPDNVGATVRVVFEEQVQQGQERQAQVVVDSNVPVNSVDIAVHYPADLLEMQKVGMEGSDFATQIFEPEANTAESKARFVQATLTPFEGEGGLVGTIDFKAHKQGHPEFVFENAQIIAHDGQGTNVYHEKLQQSVGEWLVSDVVAQLTVDPD